MKEGTVTIIYHNENAESIISSAGRISTTKGTADEIYAGALEKDREENIRLIGKIMASGHTSVLEHCSLNLSFNNVSVYVEQFMIEFRLASFTVKSRRYVDFGGMGYVMPDFSSYGSSGETLKSVYQKHMEFLFFAYDALLKQGIPKEDARFVLPYSFRSNFYCTLNARELIRVVDEMVWGRGKDYPELVRLGRSLIEQCETLLPFLKFEKNTRERKASDAVLPVPADRNESEVSLLCGPEDPETMICRAAKLSVGDPAWQSFTAESRQEQQNIIREILNSSRKRELEQAQFTILFHQVSLAGVTHLVRHRMQSILVPAYIRICDYSKYVVPESIKNAGLQDRYQEIFARTAETARQLKELGLSDFDGVYLLLAGMTVPVLTTMNANELSTFIRLRSCSRAQWEIRAHARALLKLLRERYPVLFSLYGPSCFMTGICPEGRMSCGQMSKIKQEFSVKL